MLCLTSCTTHDLVEPIATTENVENTFKVTPKQAESNVLEFIKGVSNSDKSNTRSFAGITIKNTFPLRSNDGLGTRAEESPIDTLMYFVNFDNNAGFAIAAADNRTEPILAIIDEGNYSKEDLLKEDNLGFLSFLEGAITTELEDIKNYNPEKETTRATEKGWIISDLYAPFLKTQWWQTGEFGTYCSNGVAGCGAVAVAQIMSHYQNIRYVQWNESGRLMTANINWDRIINDSKNNNGWLTYKAPESSDEVARLLRYLGNQMGAIYHVDRNNSSNNQTSVSEEAPVSCMNRFCGLSASPLKGYDEGAIISAIKQNKPVFASGYCYRKYTWFVTTGYDGGHAWIYDGYITAYKNGQRRNLIHCNWGWAFGNKNGYYVSNAFTANLGAEIKDSEVTRATSGEFQNLQYSLKYSIVSR